MSRHGRAAIVTGAGSGIGRAAAIELGRRGFRVALAGRRQAPLEETRGTMVGEALVIEADVGTESGACSIVDRTLEALGRIDAIVNNAALAPLLPIEDHTWALLEEMYRVNAIGPAVIIARAWARLVAQHETEGTTSRIVNVSSMAAVDPFPGLSGYASSKAAVNLLTRACANEGKTHGIRAFAVAPGAVETSMLRAIFPEERLPRSSTLRPEQVAGVIASCAAGERDEENGSVILVPSP